MKHSLGVHVRWLAWKIARNLENGLDPDVVSYIRKGMTIDEASFYRTNQVVAQMYSTLTSIFSRYSADLPYSGPAGVRHEEDYKDFRIDGQKIPLPRGGWSMTSPLNLPSQCPAISVPTGFFSLGIPTGMQIVGHTYSDPDVFKIASAFEATRPWSGRRPQHG
ncbi:hypothetical protein [Bradyrhizobium neotropicale]|uniref:hypothetical protein n=1 Tax=Bradyrhizobium neotropicale TaxID=1497615 RepID=UPI001FF0194E|nr:hypothetical protein [Bradyrhizobium neotropicale]